MSVEGTEGRTLVDRVGSVVGPQKQLGRESVPANLGLPKGLRHVQLPHAGSHKVNVDNGVKLPGFMSDTAELTVEP